MRHIHIYGVTFIVANHNKQRWRSISSAFHQTVRAEFLRDFWFWPCVTSIAGPYGDTQLYER